MHTRNRRNPISLVARRTFRLAFSVALALLMSYALATPLPFMAPLFAVILTVSLPEPLSTKGTVGIVALALITTGLGLLLVTVLLNYPATGLLIVALGIFLSNYVSLNLKKGAAGTFLVMGMTMITAAGVASFPLALLVVQALIAGILLAILSHHVAYLFFPENQAPRPVPPPGPGVEPPSNWAALRASIIVFPAYLMALVNPSMYMPLIMKSVSLGQQGSIVDFKYAGRELIGSTFLGGVFAILFWAVLKLHPTLWMFFLWMLIFGLFFSASLYGVTKSRFSPSFWVNVVVTLLILLGPAVADSANGDDVFTVFAVRLSLFFAVTFYAWGAIYILEILRDRKIEKRKAVVSLR